MTIEQKHYVLGFLRVWVEPIPVGKTIHLKTIHYSEADALGYSGLGLSESKSESLTVRQPDIVSINRYNPNRGPMDKEVVEYLSEKNINEAKLGGNLGCCLGSLIGYRSKISWKPTKTK
ncbi:MAG: hypothetical protein Q7R97_04210 [Candidatus Daviesbacteria bacterium]|nr:hypothetical protein [Candidatus Daviesbacteria bacterium]